MYASLEADQNVKHCRMSKNAEEQQLKIGASLVQLDSRIVGLAGPQ